MDNTELIDNLSDETMQKIMECKNEEEIKKILSEAGIKELDDEILDKIVGGLIMFRPDPDKKPGTRPFYP